MRVAVLVLALVPLAGSVAQAHALKPCPRDRTLGALTFLRAGKLHRVSLKDCADRVVGPAPSSLPAGPLRSPDGRFAARVHASGAGRSAKQTIWITDRRNGRSHSVFSETEYYKRIGPRDTPGPVWLLGWSGDDRWIFFTIDPGGSGSIAADGLILRIVSASGGTVHRLGRMLPYRDYLAWCWGRLVFTGGGDRVAAHAKRLLVAAPPRWQTQPLWTDRARSFGSLACAPDAHYAAVLSQRSSTNPSFFATRWQLWRVGPKGDHELLDRPPAGFADESPKWLTSDALAFVREREGHGRLWLWRSGRAIGPIATLGYSLGYYGHHAWWWGT